MSYTTDHILNCDDPLCPFCHRVEEEEYAPVASVFSFPTSLQQKEAFKAVTRDRILGGTLNPLEFYRQAKLVESVIEDLKKDPEIFECAQQERQKYGKEKAVINGSVIDTSSRTTYDYKSCNDSIWNDLKEKLSQREKYLKALPPQGAVDPETGELVLPPVSKVSEFITVKI